MKIGRLWITSILLFSFSAIAAPTSFVYQGQIIKPDSTPLEAASVDFTVQIYSDDGNECLLYEETHNLNMTSTSGVFSLTVGSGTRSGASYEDTSTIPQILNNNQPMITPLTCTVGSDYTPASGDKRRIRVTFNDGGGPVVVANDHIVNSVPYAEYASRVGGLSSSELLQVNTTLPQVLSQANLEWVFENTRFPELQALIGGTSTQYISSTPTATVDFNGQVLDDLGAPVDNDDATTKGYVDGAIAGQNLDASITGIGAGQDGMFLSWDNANNRWEMVAQSTTDSSKLARDGSNLMTGNLPLNGNYISNDGGAGEGLTFDTTGNGTFGQDVTVTGGIGVTNGINSAGDINLETQSELRLQDDAGGEYIGFQAPTGVTSYTMQLPNAAGATNQILKLDASGNLQWAADVDTDSGGDLNNGGNAGAIIVGSNDNTLSLESNGTNRLAIDTSGNTNLLSQGELRLQDDAGGEFIGFQAPTGVTSYTMQLPNAAGATNQILKLDASGNLQWAADVDTDSGGDLNNGGNAGAIIVGSNDNTLSLESNGTNRLAIDTSGNTNLLSQGELRLQDDAGGEYIGFQAPTGVTSYTMQLPNAAGATNQILKLNASGNLIWAADDAAGAGTITDGGNTLTQSIELGTNDNFALNLRSNGTDRMTVEADGDVNFDANTLFVDESVNRVGVGTDAPGAQLDVEAGVAGTIGLIVQGNASDDANLLELKNNAGTNLAVFNQNGYLDYHGNNPGSWTSIIRFNDWTSGGFSNGLQKTASERTFLNLVTDNTTNSLISGGVDGEAERRVYLSGGGALSMGDGATAPDTEIIRAADGGVELRSVDNPTGTPAARGYARFPTNTGIEYGLDVARANTGGAGAAGIGTGIQFSVENTSSDLETIALIDVISDTAVTNNQSATVSFKTDISGTSGERFQIKPDGNLVFRDEIQLSDADDSDYVGFAAPATVGASYTMELPAAAPGLNQILKADASGNLIWAADDTGAAGTITDGGNTLTQSMEIGTNDSFDLNLRSNGTDRMTIEADGDFNFDSNTLFIDESINSVGIGTDAPIATLNVEEVSTVTSGNVRSTFSRVRGQPGAASTGRFYGGEFQALHDSGASDVDTVMGVRGIAQKTTGGNTQYILGSDSTGQNLSSAGTASLVYGSTSVGVTNAVGATTNTTAGIVTQARLMDGSSTYVYGARHIAENTLTGNPSHVRATFSQVNNSSTGTITNAFGNYIYVNNVSTGTITDARGVYVDLDNPSGTVTDWYGIYTEDTSGLASGDNFAIYTNGAVPSYFGGNVGIGTATAGASLDVNGDAQIRSELRLSDADNSNYVGFVSPATVASNEVWTLPAADGSANQVLSTDGSGNLVWANDVDTNSGGDILNGGNTTGGIVVVGTNDNNDFRLEANGTSHLAIEAGGNIGINTNNPTSKFEVKGNDIVAITDASVEDGSAVVASFGATDPGTVNTGEGSVIRIDGVKDRGAVSLGAIYRGTNKANPDFAFFTGQYVGASGSGHLERMRIEGNGDVGIGTDNPGDLVHIYEPDSSANASLTIENSGADPYSQIKFVDHVAAPGDQTSIIAADMRRTGGDFGSALHGLIYKSGRAGFANHSFLDDADNVQMVIVDAGDVGMGTTVPSTKLDVHGRITADVKGTASGDGGSIVFEELDTNGQNFIGFRAPDSLAGDQVWELPAADGSANQVLQTNGSGVLSWVNNGAGAGDIVDGGNGTGSTVVVGTNDAQNFELESNGTTLMTLESDGHIGIGTNNAGNTLHVYETYTGTSNHQVARIDFSANPSGVVPWNQMNALEAVGWADGTNNGQNTIVGGQLSSISNNANPVHIQMGVMGGASNWGNASVNIARGVYGTVWQSGAGSIGSGHAVEGVVQQLAGSGTITNAVSFYSDIQRGAGTITNAYGLYIDDFDAATNKWGVYQREAAANNLFAGDVRLTSDDRSNYVGLKAPDSASSSVTFTLPETAGTSGQVLSTDGTGTLSWTSSGGSGDILDGGNSTGSTVEVGTADNEDFNLITNGNDRIQISNSGDIDLRSNNGGLDILYSGAMRMDVSNWIYLMPHGSQAVAITNGKGLGLFDTDPDAHIEISNNGTTGGNSFMISSDDANDGDLMIFTEAGSMGIGSTTPQSTLTVNGAITNDGVIADNDGTIDFALNNIQYTTNDCSLGINLHNMKSGGSYTFIVQGDTADTCSFNAYSDAGSTSLNVHMPTDHGVTTVNTDTIYTIIVAGTEAYFNWVPGL